MFVTDENGKWKVENNVKILIEPSESYLAERAKEAEQESNQITLPNLEERLQQAEDAILFLLMGGM